MAIGYRFTSNELAAMIKHVGVSNYRLGDIDVEGLSEDDEKNAVDSLRRNKICIGNTDDYSLDQVITVIVMSISEAKNYAIVVNDESAIVIANNSNMVTYMRQDLRMPGVWHLFPYENFVELVMDDHGKIEPLTDVTMLSADGEKHLKWAEYSERMMSDE